jgi:predicted Rossmann fold nucleotide-binding protein DprA/Smf involved in DNA uptake
MKIAVIGSRDFADYAKLSQVLNEQPGVTKIISGGAKGADSLAEQWAKEKGIETVVYKPDWAKYGRGAGVVRNRLII